MKERTRLKLKILSSLMMCILSLFSVITLTLSWFAFNDRTQGNGMNITVEHSLDYLGCEYYQVVSDSQGYGLKECQEPSLGAYGALKSDYQLIVKICMLCPEEDQFSLAAKTWTNYFLGDPGGQDDPVKLLLPPREDQPTLPNTDGKNYTNALSSIVSFGVLTEQEVSAIKKGELTALPSENRLVNFIDLTNNSVNESVTLKQGTDTEITTVADQYGEAACRAIYAFITYDPLLVNTVFSVNIGNGEMYVSNGEGGNFNIPFVCDFSLYLEETLG